MEQVTVTEASHLLDVSADTIRRWSKLGLLRCTRDKNNNRLFDLEEIRRVRHRHETPVPEGKPRFKVLTAQPTNYVSLELFAGAGGTALGMHNAGFQHIMLNEFDKNACATLRLNMPSWNVVEGDVHEVDFTEYEGKVDLLQGGVPCQAFSYAGLSRGFEDTRGTLFFEFARAAKQVQPKVLMMENVRGLLTHDHGRTIMTMIHTLDDIGYKVAIKVLHAQFLDVAQKRERLVLIGVRKDLDMPILYPKETSDILTLWDAIGDCPKSEGMEYSPAKKKVLSLVPPGGYWKDLPPDIQKSYLKGSYNLPGGKTGMARRLAWNEPSLTLTCAPAQKQTERCHPSETRPLTVREYARIQSFPDTWKFAGSIASQYKQIGNAVPCNLSFHVGRAIIAMLSGNDRGSFREVPPINIANMTTETLKHEALSAL
ncbi:DNA (cytosine-5-)-methyltransferase [Bifidobacterium erythrocebi]|nr:DNA (cytosine-5-)-methyltransferase [Bifidobacterium sp. DSM 109960]